MSLLNNIWLLLKLPFLKTKPQQVPYSTVLLLVLVLIYWLLDAVSYVWFVDLVDIYDPKIAMSLSFGGAAIIPAVWILILIASIRTLMTYYGVADRTIQVINSLLVADIFLTGLWLLWMYGLSLIHLPAGTGNAESLILILGLIAIMYWELIIYIFILINSLEISILKAGVFALFYMILQHNMSELLINVVIEINEMQ